MRTNANHASVKGNSLFSSAVLNTTVEDISQNAVLFPPPQEAPPAPPSPQPPPAPDPCLDPLTSAYFQPPDHTFQDFAVGQLDSALDTLASSVQTLSFVQEPISNQSAAPLPTFYNPTEFRGLTPPGLQESGTRPRPKKFSYARVPGLSGPAPAPQPQVQAPPAAPLPQEVALNALGPSLPPAEEPNFFLQEVSPVQAFGAVGSASNYFSMPATLTSSTTMDGGVNLAVTAPAMDAVLYRPVYHHWFYEQELDTKTLWHPFSMLDSLALEGEFQASSGQTVATDGGRYDVDIGTRLKTPVYWTSRSKSGGSQVRRCSWFFKRFTDGKLVPFEEDVAGELEEAFKKAHVSRSWDVRLALSNGYSVEYRGPEAMVAYPPGSSADVATPSTRQIGQRVKQKFVNQARAVTLKRGMDEFNIDEGEPGTVDHLLFLVHGIGPICDLRFRRVDEVVDEMRDIANQLVKTHYKTSCERGVANRIEVLPVSWHDSVHSEDTGIDNALKNITLDSLPKLREFTNGTLLDVLFYTSPVHCQTIVSSVGQELSRLYSIFMKRNPNFRGSVSLGGHSLGSLILFDILCHQVPDEELASDPPEQPAPVVRRDKPTRGLSRSISYTMSMYGTGALQIVYPRLPFNPSALFALGSPIGMFVTVRGVYNIGEDFVLPTCPAFFNIFHPYDPVAYRIEALIDPKLAEVNPVLVPHHKGRKRMHLELKETMAKLGSDLKQKFFDSMRTTLNSLYTFASLNKDKEENEDEEEDGSLGVHQEFEEALHQPTRPVGKLNKGRRIDYVLQEAPFEIVDYFFAVQSHLCYWSSEDTILAMLKEIYGNMGVSSDSQIPQQSMTIERDKEQYKG